MPGCLGLDAMWQLDGFGAKGYLRLSFATSSEIIKNGIKRIEKSLKELK